MAVYSDGHAHCFSCGAHFNNVEDPVSVPVKARRKEGLIDGQFMALPKRGLNLDTVKKFGYRVGEYKGKAVQIAPYHNAEGDEVAQKLRFPDKDFTVLGDLKSAGLFGQQLARTGGRRIVITEGEIDAMSVAQALGLTWPAVSVPNGAQGAAKAIRAQLEWLESYDEVVFWFDNDEPGIAAAAECAALISPGKAKIVRVNGYKDANEMLQAGKVRDIVSATWEARTYRPDGIISGEEITAENLFEQRVTGYSIPYPLLDEMLRGLRKRELILFAAGTGVGKSTLVRELGYHLNTAHTLSTGNVWLEESYQKTAQGYVAIDHNIPLGRLRANPTVLTPDQVNASLDKVVRNGRTHFYNHFGSLESDNLLSKLRYMAVSLKVDFILLDHISIVVSGMESSREGERKDIDRLMTKLRSLIEETGVGVLAICHLSKPEGKSHEEGGRVSLDDLRGSGTLKQIPDTIIALERDQQGDNPNEANLRVLKNREWGDLGLADTLVYNKETGRLLAEEIDHTAGF
jgi:twinkle protein